MCGMQCGQKMARHIIAQMFITMMKQFILL